MSQHEILINEENFKRLQSLAVPLVDTPDTVLKLLFDHWEATGPKSGAVTIKIPPQVPKTHFTTSRGEKLPIGLKLSAEYRGHTIPATVTVDGIEYNGTTYPNPSSAAVAAKRDHGAVNETSAQTNGWTFWTAESPTKKGYVTTIDWYRKVADERRSAIVQKLA